MELNKIRCILLDIEGTTTSISFVKETLFPYVQQNLSQYLKEHWNEPTTKLDVDALIKQSEDDASNGLEGSICIPRLSTAPNAEEIYVAQQAVCENVMWQMSHDRKTTALKQLQGHMWAEAYKKKEIHGHVYPDVPAGLLNWQKRGIKICIYSSGSIEAQKLLFKNSIHGNLLKFISGHFDTNIGSKIHPASYRSILEELDMEGNSVLFLTDVPKEAYAAEDAGLCVMLVVRPGNSHLSAEHREHFQCIHTFEDLNLQY